MTDWYQQALTPPEIVEIRLRVGLIPSQDHWQWLLEVVEPTTGVQVAQASGPHHTMTALPVALEDVLARLRDAVLGAVEPF